MTRPRASTIEAANAVLLVEGRLDAMGEFFAADYIAHLTAGALIRGHGAIRRFIREYRRAFPDLKVEVEILARGKDRIAWQRTLRATHRRAFKGFPATGRRIVWRDMVTSRFDSRGLIAEDWSISDLAERLLLARTRRRGARSR